MPHPNPWGTPCEVRLQLTTQGGRPLATKTVRSRTKKVSRANPGNNNGNSVENAILLGLKGKDRERVTAKLEAVDLPVHTVLHEAERAIQIAFFPNDGPASISEGLPSGKNRRGRA